MPSVLSHVLSQAWGCYGHDSSPLSTGRVHVGAGPSNAVGGTTRLVMTRVQGMHPTRAHPLRGLYVSNHSPWQQCQVAHLRYLCQGPAAMLQGWKVGARGRGLQG